MDNQTSVENPASPNFDQMTNKENVRIENDFMIPLTDENEELLSSDSTLSLNLLGSKISGHCNPSEFSCNEKKDHLHCKLCDNKAIPSKNFVNHFKTTHKKFGVHGRNYFYWCCKSKGHMKNEATSRTSCSHYHCGMCDTVMSQKIKFERHLGTHDSCQKRKRENLRNNLVGKHKCLKF